jgi:hypothetical protein
MGLEPQVIERIKEEKGKARRHRALIKVPLQVGISACVVLVILRFTVWSGPGRVLDTANNVLLGVVIFIFAVSLLLFIVWFLHMRRYAGRIANRMSYPQEYGGGLALKTFRDALDAVAIGAGERPPGLLVVKIPTVNSVPVRKDDRLYIAVSEEALRESPSFSEAEAMMAFSLSRIMLGHVWNAPVIFRSGLVPFFLLGILCFAVVMTLLVFLPGEANYLMIAFLAAFAIIWLLGPVGRYLFRHGDVARAHTDALTDSIAVKITGDPASLKSLIEKLAGEVREVDFTLELQYVSRYLFVCPVGAAGEPGESAGSDGEDDRGAGDDALERWRAGKVPRGPLKKTVEYGRRSLAERIENLEMIERGRWPMFERGGEAAGSS